MALSDGVAEILGALEEAWNQTDAAACARLFAPDALRAFSGPLADTVYCTLMLDTG